ncbi:MAG TPA: hypothetical protein VFI42_16080 [Thermomicrobiaceae bacterium]|nr:hypothetical protein [Thermomicrobiaceae bacterium]
MPDRTPREAVETYRQHLWDVLSCVVQGRLTVVGNPVLSTDEPHAIVLNGGNPAPLRGPLKLNFTVAQQYRLTQDVAGPAPWRAITSAYLYLLQDAQGAELFSFHWNPSGAGAVHRPHLHLGQALAGPSTLGERFLSKLHVPSGYVSLAAVVRFAIEELAVSPLRPDWRNLLSARDQAGD